ncbi:MAG TPA: hypothetical protein VIY48_11465 [Candidatus Paceibacterota bacterium]
MSRPRQEITEEDRKYLDQAAQLRAEGMSWPKIAAKVGKTMSWLRYRLDSTYNFLSSGARIGRGREIIPLTDEELKVRRHVVDIRDLTAKLMGDPIPGDRRREWEREAA